MKLFDDTDLVCPKVQAELKGLNSSLRSLCTNDYDKGFLKVLSHLTVVGNISKETFYDQFFKMKSHARYFIVVIEKGNEIVAAGTILIEDKFIHENGKIGHIEDIVVNKEFRGMNLGKLIIEELKYIGFSLNCYKIILDCSEKNQVFYEKCGFTRKEIQMVLYKSENKL